MEFTDANGTCIAPAQEVLEWEIKTFDENSQEHGPFSGYPREEIDQNWRDLLDGRYNILEA
jgi:hypothetical protein